MDPDYDTGQAAEDLATSGETTDIAPESLEGQPSTQEQTTDAGPVPSSEESFFDPSSIQDDPNLMAAYKQMQGAFTKKQQWYAQQAERLSILDQFESDPVGTLQRIAPQYGLQFQQPGQQPQAETGEPETWDDVYARAKEEVLKEVQPALQEINGLKRSAMEQNLDNNYPDWRLYEDKMMGLLNEHPTLARDPDTLYRMAVPPEVVQSRATKAAIAKMQEKTQNAQTSGKSSTPRSATTPKRASSFSEAVEIAKQKLAEEGIRPL